MSLIDIISDMTENTDIQYLDLPNITAISNNTFNITDPNLTIDNLIESLITYSYLMLNSRGIINEILWRIGHSIEHVDKYFETKLDHDAIHYNKWNNYHLQYHFTETSDTFFMNEMKNIFISLKTSR